VSNFESYLLGRLVVLEEVLIIPWARGECFRMRPQLY
jgi:hypothetical protein